MDKEKKDKVKGICGTLLFHAVLLFLLSLPFMSLSYEDPPTRKGGGSIAINLISEDKGDDPPPPSSTSDASEPENKDIITTDKEEIIVTETETDTDTDTETDTNTETDTDTETDTNTETDTDTETDNTQYYNPDTNKETDDDLDQSGYEAEFSFGFDHPGLGGINDGVDIIDQQRTRSVPTKLDYPLDLGKGYIKVMVEVDSTGKIVKISNPISTLTFTNVESSKMQGLYNAIIDQCKYGEATSDDKSNKKTELKINFIH